jgi:hypothetical protein
MAVTAQALKGSEQTSATEITSASFGIVYGTAQGGGGFVFATGDPTGDLTPPSAGWEYTNVGTGIRYQSTGTTSADWEVVIASQSLANTPSAGGMELQVGAKQYFSAYHAGATVGKVYVFDYTQTTGQEVTAITPATETTARRSGIATATTAGLTWYQVGGLAEAFVEGTTDVAAGDYLEVLNTELDWKKDASAIDVTSGAVAIDAQAADSAVLSTVFLINKIHTVAAT